MSKYYDKNGKPLTLMQWATLFEDLDYKRIGSDEKDGVKVSTVWLGLDHNFDDGKPLIFETMVFGGKDDQWQERWSTLSEAVAGHQWAVNKFFSSGGVG